MHILVHNTCVDRLHLNMNTSRPALSVSKNTLMYTQSRAYLHIQMHTQVVALPLGSIDQMVRYWINETCDQQQHSLLIGPLSSLSLQCISDVRLSLCWCLFADACLWTRCPLRLSSLPPPTLIIHSWSWMEVDSTRSILILALTPLTFVLPMSLTSGLWWTTVPWTPSPPRPCSDMRWNCVKSGHDPDSFVLVSFLRAVLSPFVGIIVVIIIVTVTTPQSSTADDAQHCLASSCLLVQHPCAKSSASSPSEVQQSFTVTTVVGWPLARLDIIIGLVGPIDLCLLLIDFWLCWLYGLWLHLDSVVLVLRTRLF